MEGKDQIYSKIDTVCLQLEAAIFLMLNGFDPLPIHSLVWAARRVLLDLHKYNTIPVFERIEEAVERRVKPEHKKEWRQAENRAANFLKHADKDPDGALTDVDVAGINEMYIVICVLALSNLVKHLPIKLVIGLSYCGYRAGKWLDFEGLCKDHGISADTFLKYKGMNETARTELLLQTYQYITKNQSTEQGEPRPAD